MIVCQRCGRENDGRYRFCLGCGAPVPRGGPPPAADDRPPLPPSTSTSSGSPQSLPPSAPPPNAAPPSAPPPSAPPPSAPPPNAPQARSPSAAQKPEESIAPPPKRAPDHQRPLSGHAPIRGVVRASDQAQHQQADDRSEDATVAIDVPVQSQSPVPIAPLPRRTGTPAVGMEVPYNSEPASRPNFTARPSQHQPPVQATAAPQPSATVPPMPVAPAPTTPPPAAASRPAPTPPPPPGPAASAPLVSQEPQSAAAQLTCVNCGFAIPPGYSFCGVCGTPTPQTPEKSPAAGPAGYLALIDELGNESERFALQTGDNRIGRSADCEVHFNDALLASHHCTLSAGKEVFRLAPVDSYNGTYVRISTPVELQHGDVLRVGQEVLRFERIEEVAAERSKSGQPLRVGCPAPRGVWGRLCQVGLTRQVANAYLLSHRDVFLGRERGDILFPKDGFVSGSHAVISERGGRVYLKDLGSSNGTFLRIKREKALRNGDLLLLGRNLLCVHVEV